MAYSHRSEEWTSGVLVSPLAVDHLCSPIPQSFCHYRTPSPLAFTTPAICSAPGNLCPLSPDLPVPMASGSKQIGWKIL